MGLDSYWTLKDDKKHPKFSPPLNLCGGLFSNHGSESFRGKIYSPFFENEFGITLYQEEISAAKVKEISEKLKSYIEIKTCNQESFTSQNRWNADLSNHEIVGLSRMFEEYANLDAALIGWW